MGPIDDDVLDRNDLRVLVETGRELAAQVDLRRLIHVILEHATRLTDSPKGSVILHDSVRDRLYFAHAVGPDAETLLKERGEASEAGIPVGKSKAGSVFRSGRSETVNAVPADPDHFKGVDRDTASETESMVCVPLTVGDQRLGVVQILNKRSGQYTDRDRVLLERFADQAAVAIRNARLIEMLIAHMGLYQTVGAPDPYALMAELDRPARAERLTVLYPDMRGSSILSLLDRPERTQALLNEFLNTLADAVLAEAGIINKFLGDGMLAFFRDDDAPLRAVRTAFVMLQRFDELRARWDRTLNLPLGSLDLGVGIATDQAVLGFVGSRVVRDYTAIGPAVNLAAHLMEAARDGRRILVDKVTYNNVRDRIGEASAERHHVEHGLSSLPYECFHLVPPATRAPKPTTAGGATIFVSYSSRDEAYLEMFRQHMKPHLEPSRIVMWDDEMIRAGAVWRQEIDRALADARAAVLLVSPSFLSSEFITKEELPVVLTAAKQRGMRIFWIPISASAYDVTPIGTYEAVHDPKYPIDTLDSPERNRALVAICRKIANAMALP